MKKNGIAMVLAAALLLASCGTQKVLNVTSVYDVKKVTTTIHNADTLVYKYRRFADGYNLVKKDLKTQVSSKISEIGYSDGYDGEVGVVVTLENGKRFHFNLSDANFFAVGREYKYYKNVSVWDTVYEYKYEKTVFKGGKVVSHDTIESLYSKSVTRRYADVTNTVVEYSDNVVKSACDSSEFLIYERIRKERDTVFTYDLSYDKFESDIRLYGECTFEKYHDVDTVSYDTVFYRTNVKCVSKRKTADGTCKFLVWSSNDCKMYWVNVDKETYDMYEEPRDPNFLLSSRTDRLGYCDYLPLEIVDRLQGTGKVMIERKEQYGLFRKR